MASFEIQSLLTNFPLDETIVKSIEKRKKVKGMLKCHFKLILSVKSSCFLFNDIYYKQMNVLMMDSPLGPALTNLILVYHEHKWLDGCPIQFQL